MARRTETHEIRLGGQVAVLKSELVAVGQSGERSLKRIESGHTMRYRAPVSIEAGRSAVTTRLSCRGVDSRGGAIAVATHDRFCEGSDAGRPRPSEQRRGRRPKVSKGRTCGVRAGVYGDLAVADAERDGVDGGARALGPAAGAGPSFFETGHLRARVNCRGPVPCSMVGRERPGSASQGPAVGVGERQPIGEAKRRAL
jgi:hypothetical protein